MLPLIIINPASAGGATRAAWPGLASELGRHFGPFNCAFTERRGEAAEIAERGPRDFRQRRGRGGVSLLRQRRLVRDGRGRDRAREGGLVASRRGRARARR